MKKADRTTTSNKSTSTIEQEIPKLTPIAEAVGTQLPGSSDVLIGTQATQALAHQPVSIDSLAIPTNFGERYAVTKILSTVPVRKPNKATFIRIKPEEEFLIFVHEDKLSGITYALTPSIAEIVPETARAVRLHRAVDRQGNQFLIPVALPSEDGRRNAWHESLMLAVSKAESHWVRVVANMSGGAYDIYIAKGELGEPDWTEHSIKQLVEIAFQGKIVSDEKDPVIQQLLGAL